MSSILDKYKVFYNDKVIGYYYIYSNHKANRLLLYLQQPQGNVLHRMGLPLGYGRQVEGTGARKGITGNKPPEGVHRFDQ